MGEGRLIAHLEKTLVQGQDGYSQGFKTQEDNKYVPVESDQTNATRSDFTYSGEVCHIRNSINLPQSRYILL